MGLERKRLEFSVGIFVIIGVCCLGYLSFTLGNFSISRDRYDVSAIFSTVSGLKTKAQIMLAGVNIGEVKNVKLKDDQAEVVMSIDKNVKIEEDAIAIHQDHGHNRGKICDASHRGPRTLTLKTAESYGKQSLRWTSNL